MSAEGAQRLTEHHEKIRRAALGLALELHEKGDGAYLLVANAAILEAYLLGDDARAGLDRSDSATRPLTFEEMPEWERELLAGQPLDRTGLCDHCDKPQTGGAAGGGLPPEHWCDDHRPADWPGSFDDVADDSAPDDEHPASVGQVPLLLDVARAHSAWIDAAEDYRPLAETVVGVVRERLSQYQGSTPVSQVFADWFGGAL